LDVATVVSVLKIQRASFFTKKMGQGASVQWTEASWNEAMKQETLGDSVSSPTSPLSRSVETVFLMSGDAAAKLDKLFIAQVANNQDASIEDVLHAIELVIGFSKEHMEDPRSGVLLCRALHSLCVLGVGGSHRKSCQKKIMREGGIGMIIDVLKRQQSPLAQRHALSALATVTCRNLAVQRAAIELQAIDACCNCMKLAQTNADETGSGELAVIAEKGCVALTALASGNPEGKSALMKKSSNALTCIINVMEAFLPAAAVQQQGCVTLATIARGDPKHKERVALTGGLSCIISAMNYHCGVASVQKEAVKALANLISHSVCLICRFLVGWLVDGLASDKTFL
jgi:hypothetical protein